MYQSNINSRQFEKRKVYVNDRTFPRNQWFLKRKHRNWVIWNTSKPGVFWNLGTTLIGSFTKNLDSLRTKFSRLWLKKGGRYTVLYLLKLGSLSNDDSDGNENGEKAISLKQHICKTTTLHVHHAFLSPANTAVSPRSKFKHRWPRVTVSRTGFITWVNIENIGRSLGLEIC